MSKIIHTELHKAARMKSSVNGNPRYALFTDHGTYRTLPDAQCAYALSAREYNVPVVLTIELGAVVRVEFPEGEGRWGAS